MRAARYIGPVTSLFCIAIACGPSPKRFATVPAPPPPREEIHGSDDPDGAAEYYLLKRRPPGESQIPVERYLTAREHIRRMSVYSSARREFISHSQAPTPKAVIGPAGGGSWEELGPANIGGRTRALLINPSNTNIMYAAAVAGGVWKSLDAGATWTPLNDLLPSLSAGTMAMDPNAPDTIYVGTGESYTGGYAGTGPNYAGGGVRGLGIFQTTDGGRTFSLLPSTLNSDFYSVNKLIVSPNNSQVLYAATQTGLWRSLDSGATFQQVLGAPGLICTDLAIRTDTGADYLFAACRVTTAPLSGSIFRNPDAAGSGQWTEVLQDSNMMRTTIAIAPSNQGIVYAMAVSGEPGDFNNGLLAVYRSASNGDPGSWEARVTNKDAVRLNTLLLTNPFSNFADICSGGARTFANQGNYDNALAVDPLNPDVVWAGGVSIFRSDDGGRNWGIAGYETAPLGFSTAVHADVHLILFHPNYDGQTNRTMFLAGDGGIFRTDNALAPVATGDRAPCDFTTTQVNWTKLDHNYATTQFYHGAVYPGGHFYFGGAQDNGTSRGSDNSGPQNWTFIQGGDGGYNAVDPTNVNRLFVEFQRAAVLNWFRRSTDGGKTLTVAMTGINEPADPSHFLFATPFAMDPSEPNRLYFAGQTLWRTNDGAGHWSAAGAPVPSGIISSIGISPLDSNRVFAGTTSGFIHRSTAALAADASTVWDRVQPRAGYVSSFAFDPANPAVAYATYSTFNGVGANVGHVFMTPDGGLSWTRIDGTGDSSIPDIPVHSIVVNPFSPNTLYAGTDLGVFVSLDGGASWAREDTQFPTTEVASMTIDTGNGAPVLYAFTHGRGAWRVRLTGDPPCSYNLSSSGTAIAFGETRPLHVDTGPNCVWSAFTSSFASLEPPATGSGPGDLLVTFPLNQGTVVRVATIQVADQVIQMSQDRHIFPSLSWDDVSRAFAIPQLPFAGVQDTRGATSSSSDPTHSCTGNAAEAKTVWLSNTATFTGTAVLKAELLHLVSAPALKPEVVPDFSAPRLPPSAPWLHGRDRKADH